MTKHETTIQLENQCRQIAAMLENPGYCDEDGTPVEDLGVYQSEDGDWLNDPLHVVKISDVDRYEPATEDRDEYLIYAGKIYGPDHGQTIIQDYDNNRWIIGGEDIDIREMSGFDYMQDVLDIRFTVQRDRSYLAAEVLVAFGGPNIWINTLDHMVEGYWGSDVVKVSFRDNIGLDDACEELWGLE